MFTGIITDIGKVVSIERTADTIRLVLSTSYDTSKITLGASIACNGCCLTVVKKTKDQVEFDLSPETVAKTNFKNLKKHDPVNLEQALKMGDELGGHLVTGHIDCIAKVISVQKISGNWIIKMLVPAEYKKYIAAKGSATINGVSLTVNNVENDIFEVNIIPHTLEHTNLYLLDEGTEVNFEIDLLARYLERLIQK